MTLQPPYADVHAWIGERLRSIAAGVEQACEEALERGDCGVLIVHHPLAFTDAGLTATATIQADPTVPYGEIWERWE